MQRKGRSEKNKLRGVKVLVMGLGLHGGGVATVQWLLKHGAKVTVTDMRDKATLAPALHMLRGLPVHFVLGKHEMKDFQSHDVVVVNPGVPRESTYLRAAQKSGKIIENVASLFFRALPNPSISVTGTRGKTTTTLWVAELLKKKYPDVRQSGTPENALLAEFDRIQRKKVSSTPVVTELSSWQLEYLPASGRAPNIAAITNIYPEHLNRYGDIRDYADAKANIFLHQSASDMLVLNYDDPWHKYFLKKKPNGALYYISTSILPRTLSGAYIKNGKLVLRIAGREQILFSVVRFRNARGEHNLENLLRAVLMAKLFAPPLHISEREVLHLPTPHMRQETIYKRGRLSVLNDSCATSPDGTIAAIERFRKEGNIVLIAGGTDKKLEFEQLAALIKRSIPPEQLVLLNGSATTKLFGALHAIGYDKKHPMVAHEDLAACVRAAFAASATLKGKTIILFSPASASFEKFLHEFDRGKQFNKLVSRTVV
jgi:UDP-N-acetylmuramoylalanine--D-glutamate ligase